jgi:AcrR family transcriptional regulator
MEKTKKLSTKKKILLEAIKQYNQKGILTITSRHIAADIGISYGNLDYHFKNKETLLLAIYKQMRTEMDASYQSRDSKTNVFEYFFNLLLFLEQFQYKYRFFNQEVLEIVRAYPKISKLLKKTIELREEQMEKIFDELVAEGFLIEKSNETYLRLQHTIRIVITFWTSKQQVITNYRYSGEGEMTRHIWELLKPYLTKKGIKVYDSLLLKIEGKEN